MGQHKIYDNDDEWKAKLYKSEEQSQEESKKETKGRIRGFIVDLLVEGLDLILLILH